MKRGSQEECLAAARSSRFDRSVVWKGPVEAGPCPPYLAAVETVYYADAAKTQVIGTCLRDCWGGYTCDGSTSPYTTTNRYRCDC